MSVHNKPPISIYLSILILIYVLFLNPLRAEDKRQEIRFGNNGVFRILQVADMHYDYGKSTECLDVLPYQKKSCSDFNTTEFVRRMIRVHKPNLVVFTGENEIDSLKFPNFFFLFLSFYDGMKYLNRFGVR